MFRKIITFLKSELKKTGYRGWAIIYYLSFLSILINDKSFLFISIIIYYCYTDKSLDGINKYMTILTIILLIINININNYKFVKL